MKKRKFLLLAGILGLVFGAGACSLAPNGIHEPRAEEIGYKDIAHDENNLGLKLPQYAEENSEGSKKGGTAPVRQWEDKDTGFVIFGVLMGVSLCMIGAMATLSILKKKKAKGQQEEQQ